MGTAGVRFFEVDHYFGVMILPRRIKGPAGARSALLACPSMSCAKAMAEQRFEKVAELRCVAAGESALGKLEARVPVRWRAELLVRFPFRAEPVVSHPFFRILQHFIGLAQLLEARLRLGFLAYVGMIFARQLPVSALDVILGSIPPHAHDLVIILEFHL